MTNPSLQTANKRRIAIANLRAELGDLSRTAARERAREVILEPGDVGGMRAGLLVRSVPGLRHNLASQAAERVLWHAGVAHDTRLRDLLPRQREALALAIALPHSEQMRLRPAHELERREMARELADLRTRQQKALDVLARQRGVHAAFAEHVRRVLEPGNAA